jgi:glycosidase
MGDNVYLGDRNGVRTPMQWNANQNAGFSRANPQQLYLPVIVDPEYHYEALNVEVQRKNRHSLLWWMKRLIALRKRFKAFGRGTDRGPAPGESQDSGLPPLLPRGTHTGGGQSLAVSPVDGARPIGVRRRYAH